MKLKVFISSKIDEFGPAKNQNSIRRQVGTVLREFDIEPFIWEDFKGPESMTPKEFWEKYLQECHVYLGLLGFEESKPTMEEYMESKLLGLERWVFVYQPSSQNKVRDSQMQSLISLARSESKYAEFDSDTVIQNLLRSKLKEFLPEKVAEYIELKKRRAHEFWSSYVRDFLEPLLTELKGILVELNAAASYLVTDFWRSTKNRPAVDLDAVLASKTTRAYGQLDQYQSDWTAAYGVFVNFVSSAVQWNIEVPLKPQGNEVALVATVCNECRAIITGYSRNLINIAIFPKEQREARLARFSSDLYEKITHKVYELKSTISGYPRGLSHQYDQEMIEKLLDDLSQTSEFKTLSNSHELAVKMISEAYDGLWRKFVELVG